MSREPIVKATKVNTVELNPVTELDQPDIPLGIEPFCSHVDDCENAVVNNVNTNPRGFDTTKPCPVCQQTWHTFDDFPVLENISHLQKCCIRWKMHLANKHRKESEPMQQTQINQLEMQCAAHNQAQRSLWQRRSDQLFGRGNQTNQSHFRFSTRGTTNKSNGLTPHNMDVVSPPTTDTVKTAFEFCDCFFPHMSMPTDIIHAHSSHPSSLDSQHRACNTDRPPTGMTHGNPDAPANRSSIKQIPIGAP